MFCEHVAEASESGLVLDPRQILSAADAIAVVGLDCCRRCGEAIVRVGGRGGRRGMERAKHVAQLTPQGEPVAECPFEPARQRPGVEEQVAFGQLTGVAPCRLDERHPQPSPLPGPAIVIGKPQIDPLDVAGFAHGDPQEDLEGPEPIIEEPGPGRRLCLLNGKGNGLANVVVARGDIGDRRLLDENPFT